MIFVMETLSWGDREVNEQLHCRVLSTCDKSEIKVLWPDWGCGEEESQRMLKQRQSQAEKRGQGNRGRAGNTYKGSEMRDVKNIEKV